MHSWLVISIVLTLGLFSEAAFAADSVQPLSREQIFELAGDKNIKMKMDKLTGAIAKTNFDWAFEDVYVLVDLDMPPDIIKMAAGKAGMFYTGNEKSLTKIAADGRETASARTIVLNNSDFVILFETYNDIKYEEEAIRERIGDFKAREEHETDDVFFLRKRKYDEGLLAAVSPVVGKIDKLTFEAMLTGGFTPHDGSCTQGLIEIDLNQISFDLFRYALGGRRVMVPINIADSNVASAKFEANKGQKFTALSSPVCVSAGAAAGLAGQGSKFKVTFSRMHDENVWSGTGSFTNAKTGGKL
ncbi:MAG: hypothetical protein GWP91_01515 [Rhodobacterales bacterium]|nr:hypothetical protein [Rhodobacterales bacterium]